jgi:hypothetical protein
MINERDIATRFSSTWAQVFPLLTPNFMSKFNQSKLDSVLQNTQVKSKGHPDVVSEMAFNISRLAHERDSAITDVSNNPILILEAFRTSVASIQKSARSSYLPEELNQEDIDESALLAENIRNFSLIWESGEVVYAPELPGYGLISGCTGDLSIGNTLFEIKTVRRNFRSKDLKQLLLYLALKAVSSSDCWTYAGLYNPRTCQYCKFEVNNIVSNLSPYSSPREAFRDLLDQFVRDVQIDKPF